MYILSIVQRPRNKLNYDGEPGKMTEEQQKKEDDLAERSQLTLSEQSMNRFDEYISVACRYSIEDDGLHNANRCLIIAMNEVLRWTIITDAEGREAYKRRTNAVIDENHWREKTILHDERGKKKYVSQEDLLRKARGSSEVWRNYIQRLGAKIWGEKESQEKKKYATYMRTEWKT